MIGIPSGSAQSFAKTQLLQQQAEQRISENTAQQKGKRTDKWQPPSWLEDMNQLSEKDNDTRLKKITHKLDMGDELSPSEMAYLSRKDPEAYKKASVGQLNRKLLEKRLERCRSREEVKKVGLQASVFAYDAAGRAEGGEAPGSRGEWTLYAIRKTYNDFHTTKQYRKLPQTEHKSRKLDIKA